MNAHFSPLQIGKPASAAESWFEHEATTLAPSIFVSLARSARSSPSTVPDGTSAGNKLSVTSSAFNNFFDHVMVTGLNNCVALASVISIRGMSLKKELKASAIGSKCPAAQPARRFRRQLKQQIAWKVVHPGL